jgi:hypothetical protein
MGFLAVIALLSIGTWIILGTARRLLARKAGPFWWGGLLLLAAIGLTGGYWAAFCFEYDVTSTLRLVSFPIPVCVFRLEGEQWVDYPAPGFFAYPAAWTNVIALTAIAILPELLASLLWHRRGTQ